MSSAVVIQKSFNSVTLNVIPDEQHSYLLTTTEVAKGYGTTEGSIRLNKKRHADEVIENIHFISDVTKCNAYNLPIKTVYWTKLGVIMLGFFIKSERAKEFRKWASMLIFETEGNKPALPTLPRPAVSRYWDKTDKDGIYSYKLRLGLSLLPSSRLCDASKFATKEAVEAILLYNIERLKHAFIMGTWQNAFDREGVKIYDDGQKVYSLTMLGDHMAFGLRKE